MDAVEIVCGHRWELAPELEVFLSGRLRGVSCHRLDHDPRVEDTPEVGDAEQQDEQHRQDEGELDQGLPPP